ncbi:MAG: hypothetical protein Q4C58_01305 [Eubacteriales bacterium]|nr:hypothetical protein [Eubacteriales bacterium]
MENVYSFYDIYPKVVQVQTDAAITIRALDRHCFFQDKKNYFVVVIPMNHITADTAHIDYPVFSCAAADNTLSFSYLCSDEQPYTVMVQDGDETLCTLSFYAVREDLYGLLPFRGNMHAHSFRSDGAESPELVAANYRKAGFDFLAITDHEQYPPSLEAIRAFEGLDLDFRLFPGEEVHTPRNKIHILNFAGEQSVNQFFRDHPDLYEQEVRAIMEKLSLTDSHEDFEYAASVWAFQKIREFNGMSILAHPNWIVDGAYNIPPAQYLAFLKERPFDALELINGGNTPYENAQQLAFWHDSCCAHNNVSVIGNDDSHGTVNGEWFNIGMTYVLSRSNSKEDLIDAMKQGLCIAVERYHNEAPHYYGSGRLISLFSFLDKAYFPLHDEICAQEGFFMTAFLQGNPIGKEGLALLKGQTGLLMKKYFSSPGR